MKTAWNAFTNWKTASKASQEAIQNAADALVQVVDQEQHLAAILRRHGPVLHDGHVYTFRDGEIVCEPCVDSRLLNLEESK